MRRGIPDPTGIVRLVRLLDREKPDVLQTWLYHADLIGIIASRLARVPALCWNIRCSDMNMYRYKRLSRFVLQILTRMSGLPDVVIANSETGRRLHERLGYSPRRWEIIPNGFDLEYFRPDPIARQSVREELAIPPGTLMIGLVARYDPMKDHPMFLEAAAQTVRERSDIHFILAGNGVEHLASQIDQLGLGAVVHLLGERRDIPRLMASLDIFSLSSAFGEGFPNVVGEAMACGIPCVVTNVGDAAYVTGETGIVVPPCDPAAMANAWKQLLEMPLAKRRSLGRNARQRVEDLFSIQGVARRYESLYRGIGKAPQSS
jgi:glycosyltransferase involved in cell wall biosynthesis